MTNNRSSLRHEVRLLKLRLYSLDERISELERKVDMIEKVMADVTSVMRKIMPEEDGD